jgi:hypothetical protein
MDLMNLLKDGKLEKIRQRLMTIQTSKCLLHNLRVSHVCLNNDCNKNNFGLLCVICKENHNSNHTIFTAFEVFSTWLLEELTELNNTEEKIAQSCIKNNESFFKQIDDMYQELETKTVTLIREARDKIKSELCGRGDDTITKLKTEMNRIVVDCFDNDIMDLKVYLNKYAEFRESYENYVKKRELQRRNFKEFNKDRLGNIRHCLISLVAQLKKTVNESFVDEYSVRSGNYQTICRFTIFGRGWGYLKPGLVDSISFSVTKELFVVGFGVFMPIDQGVVKGTAKFLQKLKEDTVSTSTVATTTTNNTTTTTAVEIMYNQEVILEKTVKNTAMLIYKCMFGKHVKLTPNIQYTIAVELSGPTSYCGDKGKSMITGDKGAIFTFSTGTESTNATDTNAGQIPEIYYYVP